MQEAEGCSCVVTESSLPEMNCHLGGGRLVKSILECFVKIPIISIYQLLGFRKMSISTRILKKDKKTKQ